MIAAAGNRQQIQNIEIGYPTTGKDSVLSPPSYKQLLVHAASVYNPSTSNMDAAVGVRYHTSAWKLWQVNASYTDLTTTVQAGSAVTILPTTNNYGFIVQAKAPFGLMSMTVSQIETGSPTYSYQYWNGSAWATLSLRNSFVYTSATSIAVAFAPPVDWAQGNGSVVTDLASGAGYCIRVRGTTAPSQAVQVTAFNVSRLWAYRNLAPKATLNVSFATRPELLESGESIQPFFATASASNSCEVSYQVSG